MRDHIKTGEKRDLAYSGEFRTWLRDHPGVIQAVRDVVQQLESSPQENISKELTFKTEAIKITFFDGGRSPNGYSYYYLKLSVLDDSYFVKVQLHNKKLRAFVRGFDEYRSTDNAKKALANIPWVEVIDAKLGYQENRGGRKSSYFVSTWRDLPSCHQYIREISKKHGTPDNSEANDLSKKIEELKKLLPDFSEIGSSNMFYDAAQKKIVLYDLHDRGKREVATNQPSE